MSTRTLWNSNWKFTKEKIKVDAGASVLGQAQWENVNLPHTWNGKDGQDGGGDYYRGTCYYVKNLNMDEICPGDDEKEKEQQDIYLEFEGTNSSVDLYVNGYAAGHHDGGYSTWRADITPYMQEENEIVVAVDNGPNERVYPQVADFTFYGGIYRNVNIICAGKTRFDLDHKGSPALAVTPEVCGNHADIHAEAYITGTDGEESVRFMILDGESVIGTVIVPVESGRKTPSGAVKVTADMKIEQVHLWNGRKDPHLYEMKAELCRKEEESSHVLDTRTARFGCRTFQIDPDRGFILNGRPYPLHGVARHQDRPDIGNALLPEHHKEDIELICEMGANTVRLAHYQHDQYFYDLCDEKGLVVWAEIPYISRHMPGGKDNTVSQMKELILQNYNHPSIVVWGLSNEITMHGGAEKDLLYNHQMLNDLVHEMDPTRLTTMAVVTMCDMDEPYVQIPDVVSYNHYYGWYMGDISMYGPFFDKFHEKYPEKPIGISEYGAEALNWHTSHPEVGDYTEEYQAYYHEELIRQLFSRPYIWATHVWNMFDFAADARAEGGENGMNHKGLVTFDRKYKKDAFYAYKAWLSDEPFVHICGKRYVDRVEDVTKVTVYSNQPEVELFVNGESIGSKRCSDHFFYFDVPNVGESTLTARARVESPQDGDSLNGEETIMRASSGEMQICEDESHIRKVDEFNEAYRMKESGEVLNWFDITEPDGYCSINDKLSDVAATVRGKVFLGRLIFSILYKEKKKKSGNKKAEQSKEKKGGASSGVDVGKMLKSGQLTEMISGMSMKRIFSLMGTAGMTPLTKKQMLAINKEVNKIKKKK